MFTKLAWNIINLDFSYKTTVKYPKQIVIVIDIDLSDLDLLLLEGRTELVSLFASINMKCWPKVKLGHSSSRFETTCSESLV